LMYQLLSLPASFWQLDIHILPFWKSLSIGENLRCFDMNLKNWKNVQVANWCCLNIFLLVLIYWKSTWTI